MLKIHRNKIIYDVAYLVCLLSYRLENNLLTEIGPIAPGEWISA